MTIGHLVGLVGLALYLGLTNVLSVGGVADVDPEPRSEPVVMLALAPVEQAEMSADEMADEVLQDGSATVETVEVAPPCRELLLLEGEYLSHILERWVRACLDKPSIWAVGNRGTYLDYELTDTRRVVLAQGFASLQEHLQQYWSVYAMEDETRVIFDNEIQE